MGLFSHFPYTNLHDLNIDWVITKVKELLAEGEALYTELREWKTDTDADLESWKTTTMAAITQWETDLTTALDAWKTGTIADYNTQFASFESTLQSYVTTFNGIQTAAEAAQTAAAASAASAAADAATIASSAAQIAENASDIAVLETHMDAMEGTYYTDETLSFSANNLIRDDVDVGDTVSLTPTTNTAYSYIIADCKKDDVFIVTCTGSSTAKAWAFIDTDNKLISKAGTGVTTVTNLYLVAPADGKLILNGAKSETRSAIRKAPLSESVEELDTETSANTSDIDSIRREISTPVKNLITQADVSANLYHIRPDDGTYGTNPDYTHSNMVYIRGARKVYVTGYYGATVCPAAFYKQDQTFLSGFTPDQGASTLYTYEIDVPEDAYYVASSVLLARLSYFKFDAAFDYSAKKADLCYISPSGDDTNDGLTESTPVYSAARAKEILSDFGTLVLMKGDYSDADLMLDLDTFHRIVGVDHPRIICGSQVITNAELASGYTRVYKAAKTSSDSPENYACLYQHDIPDESTAIPVAEAHPLNRNMLYRLPSTRLIHAESIAAIEAATDQYMWFYDTGYWYFSCPDPDHLTTNPVIVPTASGYSMGASNTDVADIYYANFAVLYNSISVARCAGTLDNVEIGMCTGAAGLSGDYCEALLVRNCNIYAVSGNSAGDGINIHNSNSSVGRRSFVTIENCWLHDCSDDGESCHENSNTVHYGTLVEYNGTGITPAGGGSVCHNVLARHHGEHPWVVDTAICAGFSCQSDGSTLTCMGCVSENNKRGYSVTETDEDAQTTLTVINSISRGNSYAEIYASRADVVLDGVTIINDDAAKHVRTANNPGVTIKGLISGIDTTGIFFQDSEGKHYLT